MLYRKNPFKQFYNETILIIVGRERKENVLPKLGHGLLDYGTDRSAGHS